MDVASANFRMSALQLGLANELASDHSIEVSRTAANGNKKDNSPAFPCMLLCYRGRVVRRGNDWAKCYFQQMHKEEHPTAFDCLPMPLLA